MNEIASPITAISICENLNQAGISVAPDAIEIKERDDRYAVLLPEEKIAWYPTNAEGKKRLAIERRVLRLLHERCTFQAPRLLAQTGDWDIRTQVPGLCDPWKLFERCKADIELAGKIGRFFGKMLAEQHTLITPADVEGWLPKTPRWPESTSSILARLPQVVGDAALLAEITRVLKIYDDQTIEPRDCCLVHTDLGLHNIAIDTRTDAVNGVFDYDSAAWADRHHDFKYLLFDTDREDMLEAALEIYELAAGYQINRNRVRLYNAVCAINYLAFRVGVPDDEKSCGRTLAEDLNWVRQAMGKIEP